MIVAMAAAMKIINVKPAKKLIANVTVAANAIEIAIDAMTVAMTINTPNMSEYYIIRKKTSLSF